MSVYIVNGAPTAGKTTFENYVSIFMGDFFCKSVSTIDFVKEIARKCGWNGVKTDKSRAFLSDLKKLLTNFDNIPANEVCNTIGYYKFDYQRYNVGPESWAVFVDCREPKEIEALKTRLNAKTILISRNAAEAKPTSNSSDADVLDYTYDIIIENNGDLRDLANAAYNFVKKENLHLVKKPFIIDFFGNVEMLEEDD